jgi:two-component system LytT family response regulator
MKKIRVLIIDDERAARNEIRCLLLKYPDFEIIAEAGDADEAKLEIESKHPDLLFLDIQMPGRSGFDLLESLEIVPRVIFVTAFDQYALKAFEVSALDYLMKPIREERFAKAIEQIRVKVSTATATKKIFVRDRQQYHLVSWDQVHLIESMDNYARLFFENKNVFLKTSLNQLENVLDEAVFFRINRAQIINLSYVIKIGTASGGRLTIDLSTGGSYEVSDRQSVKLKKRLGGGSYRNIFNN